MPTKILLADDSITIQKIVHQTFEHESVELTLVGNGDAAIRKMHEVAPDLVLADIFMPGKSGYEVCEYVKQQPELASVPVILLVGAFEPFDEKEATRVHADDHLKKPFAPQMLVETIRRFVTFEPTEMKARESTSPEATPSPPAPAETRWHAEQTQVIPLTPPADLSPAITQSIDEAPQAPPPLPMASEKSQDSAVEIRVDLPPPVSELTPVLEETETPLEISHVHQPAMDESVMEAQQLVSEPELVPPLPILEPGMQEVTAAAQQDVWSEPPPLILEEPPTVLPEPTREPEPAGLSEARGELKSLLSEAPVAGPLEDLVREASAETGSVLESATPVAEVFADAQERLSPSPFSESAPELAPAVAAPEMTTAHAPHMTEPEASGSALTDEFKEFQRELVRHAPAVMPQLGEEPFLVDRTFQPSPEESGAPIEEEVMGPPAPPIPPEDTLGQLTQELAAIPTPPPLGLAEPIAIPPHEFAETPSVPSPELAEPPLVAPEKPAAPLQAAMPGYDPGELSQEMIDAIAQRVVERMSSRVVEEIAWEVVPEIAETLLRKSIAEKK